MNGTNNIGTSSNRTAQQLGDRSTPSTNDQVRLLAALKELISLVNWRMFKVTHPTMAMLLEVEKASKGIGAASLSSSPTPLPIASPDGDQMDVDKPIVAAAAGDNASRDFDSEFGSGDDLAKESFLDAPSGLTKEQSRIWFRAMNGDSFFYTGAAGTGKSYMLNMLIDRLKEVHGSNRVYVTAPSGIAALLVGGSTIHSFAGLNIDMDEDWDLKCHKARKQRETFERWTNCRVLIIDEVSMLSAKLFRLLDHMAKNLRSNNRPFGGIQVILCGDFLQLPPVNKVSEEEKARKRAARQQFRDQHLSVFDQPDEDGEDEDANDDDGGKMAFECAVWDQVVGKRCFKLTKIYRQADPNFVSVLNEVRLGKLSDIGHSRLLQCVGRRFPEGVTPTYLYPTRKGADEKNRTELFKLKSTSYVFKAKDKVGKTEDIDRNCLAPSTLELKIGAEVILLKNLDLAKGLANGTRGRVVAFSDPNLDGDTDEKDDDGDKTEGSLKPIEKNKRPPLPYDMAPSLVGNIPLVRFDVNGIGNNPDGGVLRWIGTQSFKSTRGEKVLSERVQLPLMLGYAVTVHKSQGMTLDYVTVSLQDVFEHGQAYVALSRARSIEGLCISSQFQAHIVHANPTAIEFEKTLAKLT